MDRNAVRALLASVQDGTLSVDDAVKRLQHLPYEDLGFARVDTHRQLRTGVPEVVYCAGKTVDQILAIAQRLHDHGAPVLGTRASDEALDAIVAAFPEAKRHDEARCFTIGRARPIPGASVAVLSGGTSDLPIACEAAITAETFGCQVETRFDVGVAGLHRLLDSLPVLTEAKVVIAVAGMEGALPSVISGLTDKPVIAVPTSIGYGASFGGLAALLTMLNSCAPGTCVVNIDNGFGAGYLAARICRLLASPDEG